MVQVNVCVPQGSESDSDMGFKGGTFDFENKTCVVFVHNM